MIGNGIFKLAAKFMVRLAEVLRELIVEQVGTFYIVEEDVGVGRDAVGQAHLCTTGEGNLLGVGTPG